MNSYNTPYNHLFMPYPNNGFGFCLSASKLSKVNKLSQKAKRKRARQLNKPA